jgi:hypothetical protein
MATGYVILPVGSPDKFTCGMDVGIGGLKLLFDAAADESAEWKFPVPGNYASAPVIRYGYSMAGANSSKKVDLEWSVWAVSSADAADMDTASYDTPNASNPTVPDTAGYPDVQSVALTNADGMVADDVVLIRVNRDANDATNDTAAGDFELRSVIFEYTVA